MYFNIQGEFYQQLAAIKDDPNIKDKKLLHFVNYLVASTDYPSFYKVMARAAKKVRAKEYDRKWENIVYLHAHIRLFEVDDYGKLKLLNSYCCVYHSFNYSFIDF